ncbi:MAG: HEAT repeat domain-containing protein [Phycisphaerae bacterium]|nr:HEAT repeat domain-containing protein [Phycisphaerae bacterium]
MRYGICTICLWIVLSGFLGCAASTPTVGTVAQRLQAEDPAVRIQAAVEAGNTGDKKVVPLLVDRLTDTDSDVRFYAGMALEKIVGREVSKHMGWVSYDPPEQRNKAVMRWRTWVRKHYGKATSQPGGEATSQPTTEPS